MEGAADKSRLRMMAESAFFWWRVVVTSAGVLALAWAHFIGPGVRGAAREFLGIVEVVDRLGYIERTMPAPSVVEWLESASGQVGECNHDACLYRLVGARTEFGESCGRPQETIVYIRLQSGRQMRIRYDHGWTPIELGRVPEEFIVPLVIPPIVGAGDHYWRSRVIYPDCAGPNEPIPRYSPWFSLRVSD